MKCVNFGYVQYLFGVGTKDHPTWRWLHR